MPLGWWLMCSPPQKLAALTNCLLSLSNGYPLAPPPRTMHSGDAKGLSRNLRALYSRPLSNLDELLTLSLFIDSTSGVAIPNLTTHAYCFLPPIATSYCLAFCLFPFRARPPRPSNSLELANAVCSVVSPHPCSTVGCPCYTPCRIQLSMHRAASARVPLFQDRSSHRSILDACLGASYSDGSWPLSNPPQTIGVSVSVGGRQILCRPHRAGAPEPMLVRRSVQLARLVGACDASGLRSSAWFPAGHGLGGQAVLAYLHTTHPMSSPPWLLPCMMTA